jgi:hypothetical protein
LQLSWVFAATGLGEGDWLGPADTGVAVRGAEAVGPCAVCVPQPARASTAAAAITTLMRLATAPPARRYADPPLPTTFGPSGPPMISVSVRPTNRPCSTTPVVPFSALPNAAASLMPPSSTRFRIRLPLSVM